MIINCVDGSFANIPDTYLEELQDFSFVVFRQNGGRFYILIAFENNIDMSYDGTYMIFNVDNLDRFYAYSWDSAFDSYLKKDLCIGAKKLSYSQYSFLGCSEDLLSYVDVFSKDGFEFDWADYSSVMVSSLRYVDMTSGAVLGELFGVLPILLVVLVSFIGIRKGISYLFSLLKKS